MARVRRRQAGAQGGILGQPGRRQRRQAGQVVVPPRTRRLRQQRGRQQQRERGHRDQAGEAAAQAVERPRQPLQHGAAGDVAAAGRQQGRQQPAGHGGGGDQAGDGEHGELGQPFRTRGEQGQVGQHRAGHAQAQRRPDRAGRRRRGLAGVAVAEQVHRIVLGDADQGEGERQGDAMDLAEQQAEGDQADRRGAGQRQRRRQHESGRPVGDEQQQHRAGTGQGAQQAGLGAHRRAHAR